MNLTTIGLGYIGLPTSIMFAKHGVSVTGVDINEDAVESLNNGVLHLEEPFLDEALKEVIEAGTFKASLKPQKADCFIIAVPTPNNDDQYKSCDIGYVMSACESIIPYVEKGNVVIVESTIAPRTMDDHVKPFFEEIGFTIGEDLFLVHCPERVLPGQIMHELIHNNRIIGGITPACTKKAKEVYAVFVQGEMIETNAKTAEMSKLMENTYRDTNIALANELAKICFELDINALEVIEMANKHPRVNLHSPGPGVGGHCLAVDPYFIIAKSPENSPLIQNARSINNSMPEFIVDKVRTIVEKKDAKKISVFGLTYKGNVDDIRESPAMDIYHMLQKEFNIDVVAHDPHVKKSFVEKDVEKAVNNSSLILVLSDHNEFKDLEDVAHLMKDNIILDTKNIVTIHDNYQYFNMGSLYQLKEIL
ncbi:UDP-N-acetyl-D-mannosamine dehydrogenase [Macrococcoides caseolyticum]|uniref:nucleotide sugar dehydrogenase n=1 Tax=Macrococcoides caseolyticum TaxID=69966 RepID=UPI000C31DAAD|nr:nucleotide sugar dehydrogenase [Macrococcus caseolyticus]PKF46222.1 UDP-N-acetyl-D-mannosamine dehydrogenase [Macrococcus caseolyticus]